MRDCSLIANLFENLAGTGFHAINDCTSDRTIDQPVHYNCIAWAAGSDSEWWWPWDLPGYHWPPGLPKERPAFETLQNFVNAFKTKGYEECENGEFEPGYEKVAIFVNNRNTPTHAARSLPDGGWTSKLGEGEDIRHATLFAIEGRLYGHAAAYLRRIIIIENL